MIMRTTNNTPATACALFLLSLTIGTSEPAQIYTNDPAGITAQAKAATDLEVTATWEEVTASAELPAADVPALLNA